MLRGTVVLVVALTAGADRSVIAQTRPAAPAGSSDLAAGRKVFDAQCAWCHGTDGAGGTGPNLQGRLTHATDLKSIVEIITGGIPGAEMPAFRSPLTEEHPPDGGDRCCRERRRELSPATHNGARRSTIRTAADPATSSPAAAESSGRS
jgi:cytochrome c553